MQLTCRLSLTPHPGTGLVGNIIWWVSLIAASTLVAIHSAMVIRGHRKETTFSYLKRKQKNSWDYCWSSLKWRPMREQNPTDIWPGSSLVRGLCRQPEPSMSSVFNKKFHLLCGGTFRVGRGTARWFSSKPNQKRKYFVIVKFKVTTTTRLEKNK